MQVNLVDWLKMMVGSRRSEEVVDPNIEARPSTRALKRALLTALRCVDPDSEKRPKMSQVVRMLESEEYPIPREVSFFFVNSMNNIFISFCNFSNVRFDCWCSPMLKSAHIFQCLSLFYLHDQTD